MGGVKLSNLAKGAAEILVAVVILGCTVTPRIVNDSQPSFDEGKQNSGFLGYTADGSAVITSNALARYNALCVRYGTNFLVPVRPGDGVQPFTNGTFLIDAQHNVDAQKMNRWLKEGR